MSISTDIQEENPAQSRELVEGRKRSLGAHLAKAARPDHPQARWFAVPDLECSWTTNDSWLGHQRLELENDLIAAHVLEHGAHPSAQFLG